MPLWFPYVMTTVVASCVGMLVWAVRLEGRINNHDILLVERKEAIEQRLQRIEEKLDSLLPLLVRKL